MASLINYNVDYQQPIYYSMSVKHPHDPTRFQVYKELADGSGFTINGSPFIFKFDRFGGWFDQFANYYNSEGQPEDPPSDSDQGHSQGSHSHHSPADEDQDQFQKQFGGPSKNFAEDQDQTEDIHLSKIVRNLQLMNSYPSGRPFRINFKNLPYTSKRSEVFSHFKSKVTGLLNVVFLENEKRQFNGNGYFIVEDAKSAESLIRLEGQVYNAREISFHLDEVEEFLLDPITNEELFPDFSAKKTAKSYITKGNPTKIEQKTETPQKQEKKHVKAEVKVESPLKKQVVKAENEQEFASYIFQRKPFPKKSSFNQWIEANKFSHQNDIKEVSKIEGDESRAKVTMKRKIFNKLNGTICNEVVVSFKPTQA